MLRQPILHQQQILEPSVSMKMQFFQEHLPVLTRNEVLLHILSILHQFMELSLFDLQEHLFIHHLLTTSDLTHLYSMSLMEYSILPEQVLILR